jgi:hypothetical protein
VADPAVYNAVLNENKCIQSEIQDAALAAAEAALASCPADSANWGLLPLLDSPTGCLCVTNMSGRGGCGVGCTWTVPSGTSKVQFQLWGPGASTMNGMCCAGSPYGQNGAYATVIIDANPGDSYTLCAGCAACCYGYCSQGYIVGGSNTYVNGNGISGLCAESGCSRISCGMKDLHGSIGQCRWRGVGSSDSSSACICGSGSWYCFDNSCETCGEVPLITGVEFTYSGSSTSGTVKGLPGIWGGGCFNRDHYGYMVAPPVISPCHTEQPNSCVCHTFTSGSCCGGCRCRAQDGYRCYPGAGGTFTHMMGGAMYWSGDYGRAGMVRVTWC